MISPMNAISVSYVSPLRQKKSADIVSFKGTADSFETGVRSVFGFLPNEKAKDIITKTSDESKKIASGFKANIFRLGDFAVKVPQIVAEGKPSTEIDLGQNLKEFFALKEVQKINPNIAVKAHDVIEHKGIYSLVEDFVSGTHPHKGKIRSGHMKDLLSKFTQLDQNGIVNCDLQSGNIFLLENDKTKLIDFGSFAFLRNTGDTFGSDEIPPAFFKKGSELYRDINKPNKTKFMRTFFARKFTDIKNLADNPYLNSASNTSNFEFRTLYKYLMDGKEQNPLEFFREYVKNKGNYYHKSMEDFLRSLNLDDVVLDSDTPEKIEAAKTMLKKAINYEGVAKEILANPTDDVLRTELGKIQIRTFLNSDMLGSKVPNSKKIQSAYNQLISLLEKNIATSEGKQKKYYLETLNSLKARFKDFVFKGGQVDIPDDENLIKRVFGEIKTKVKPKDKIDDAANAIKKSNKKIYMIAVSGLALFGIGAAFLYKKNKLKNLNTKQINGVENKTKNTLYNTFINKQSNIFSEFKQ